MTFARFVVLETLEPFSLLIFGQKRKKDAVVIERNFLYHSVLLEAVTTENKVDASLSVVGLLCGDVQLKSLFNSRDQ